LARGDSSAIVALGNPAKRGIKILPLIGGHEGYSNINSNNLYLTMEKTLTQRLEEEFNPRHYDNHRWLLAWLIWLHAQGNLAHNLSESLKLEKDSLDFVFYNQVILPLKNMEVTPDNTQEFLDFINKYYELNPRHLDIYDIGEMERKNG